MSKNQKKFRTKKNRRDLNHAESLDNIEFFSIIIKNLIMLVYGPSGLRAGFKAFKLREGVHTEFSDFNTVG